MSRWVRRFHEWVPGKVYTPIPLKYIDLHHEYHSILSSFVARNIDRLASHYNIPPEENEVMHRLLDFTYTEKHKVVESRARHPKSTLVDPPLNLLRSLYAQNPRVGHIERALQELPEANEQLQAKYIEATHLERLIRMSMTRKELCVTVFQMLEAAGLPTTAREKAQYIYQCFHQTSSLDWQGELARLWPDIVSARDVGALNILLKLSARAGNREMQNLVEYHLQNQADRFTFMSRLRSLTGYGAAQETLRKFLEKRFVLDIEVFSSFSAKMLQSRKQRYVTLAEERFEKLLKRGHGIKPIVRVNLSTVLRGLDRANQIVTEGPAIQLPMHVDAVMLRHMYAHYVNMQNHERALNVAINLAQQDEVLPRHVVFSHIKDTSVPLHVLEQLFYLCCDVNTVHPRFISNDLALVWAKVIAQRKDEPLEQAVNLVDNCRAAITL